MNFFLGGGEEGVKVFYRINKVFEIPGNYSPYILKLFYYSFAMSKYIFYCLQFL